MSGSSRANPCILVNSFTMLGTNNALAVRLGHYVVRVLAVTPDTRTLACDSSLSPAARNDGVMTEDVRIARIAGEVHRSS